MAALSEGSRYRSAPPQVRFVVPIEGTIVRVRSWCIPILAPHPVAAHAWLANAIRPATARAWTVAIGRATPVESVITQLPASIVDDPAVYPPSDAIPNLIYQDVSADGLARARRDLGSGGAMIGPLLWLLLAAAGVLQPPVVTWDGKAPVVISRPAQPKAGEPIAVAVGRLPAGARRVEVAADGLSAPAPPRRQRPASRHPLRRESGAAVDRRSVHAAGRQIRIARGGDPGGARLVIDLQSTVPIRQSRRFGVEESRDTVGQGCRVTPGRGNPMESATESRPPTGVARERRGKGETVV